VDLGPAGASPEDGTASAKGLPFLWKGIRLDEVTGLLQMRNRYYSVELGRFLTRDPLGVWRDGMNAGNEFGYVGCCPLVVGDCLGLQADRSKGGTAGGGRYKGPGDVTPEQHAQGIFDKASSMPSGGETTQADPKAGKVEIVLVMAGLRKRDGLFDLPTADEVARALSGSDWVFNLCGPTETAGVVMFNRRTAEVIVVREGRNPSETSSGSRRLFCEYKSKFMTDSVSWVVKVAGFHTHPSKGSTTDPNPGDREEIDRSKTPEIIATKYTAQAHSPTK
jgi:RHS repeat-associated protein